MNLTININADEVVKYTNKLEKLHRSGLPSAIRSSLNKAAFDVKQNTMPRSASKEFINRQPNFFKANSRVQMADGFDLRTMKAVVGFTEQNLKGGSKNKAVEELEQQERGGKIPSRSFVPMSTARPDRNQSKLVKPANRLSAIKNIVNASDAKGKNRHEKFIKSAVHAGKGGYVIDNGTLWRINSITTRKVRLVGRYGKTRVKASPIYSFEKGRSVTVAATHFMSRASLESAS
jgi:hypothetical protein